MSLKTGAVISSLPYIPGKYAIATADIFVNIPTLLSLSCVASATIKSWKIRPLSELKHDRLILEHLKSGMVQRKCWSLSL
jgi:hypothetical protein